MSIRALFTTVIISVLTFSSLGVADEQNEPSVLPFVLPHETVWEGSFRQPPNASSKDIRVAGLLEFDGATAILKTSGTDTDNECTIRYEFVKSEKKRNLYSGENVIEGTYRQSSKEKGFCGELLILEIMDMTNIKIKGVEFKDGRLINTKFSKRKRDGSTLFGFMRPSSLKDSSETLGSCPRLVSAATIGNLTNVEKALSEGADVNCVFLRETALYNAIRHIGLASDDNLAVIKTLVYKGANVQKKDQHTGGTPTTLASYLGHTKTTSYLLDNGGTEEDIRNAKEKSAAKLATNAAALAITAGLAKKVLESLSDSMKNSSGTYNNSQASVVTESEHQSNLKITGVQSRYRENDYTYVVCNKNVNKRWGIFHDKYGTCSHPFHFGTFDCANTIKDVQDSCN